MKNICPPILALLVALGTFLTVSHAVYANEQQLEYKLKAAFLLNFAKFTTWPEPSSADFPFAMCILGENTFGDAFKGIEQKTIGQRQITLTQTTEVEKAEQCNVVFISDTDGSIIDKYLQALSEKPILTVSDVPGFAGRGGGIELKTVKQRLGFIINNSQMKKNGLKMSAPLLDLAIEVY